MTTATEKTKEIIQLSSLERDWWGNRDNPQHGLTVKVNIGRFRYTVFAVPENIIRCAIGEEDMKYLLGEQVRDDYKEGDDEEFMYVVPDSDEGQCFSLSPSEFKDCMKHGELDREPKWIDKAI